MNKSTLGRGTFLIPLPHRPIIHRATTAAAVVAVKWKNLVQQIASRWGCNYTNDCCKKFSIREASQHYKNRKRNGFVICIKQSYRCSKNGNRHHPWRCSTIETRKEPRDVHHLREMWHHPWVFRQVRSSKHCNGVKDDIYCNHHFHRSMSISTL